MDDQVSQLSHQSAIKSLPLQGGGQEGDGFAIRVVTPHPHPVPPLEGEGTRSHARIACDIASRIAAAILGGYVFAWGFAAFGSTLLTKLGVARSEAVVSATMLGFVAHLIAALWAFATARVLTVWLVLAVGGGAMTLLAHLWAGVR